MTKFIASILLLFSLILFLLLSFLNHYEINEQVITTLSSKVTKEQKPFITQELALLKGKNFGKIGFYNALQSTWQKINISIETQNLQNPDKKINKIADSKDLDFWAMKYAGASFPTKQKGFLFWFLFINTLFSSLLYIVPMFWDGHAGIKNNGIFS